MSKKGDKKQPKKEHAAVTRFVLNPTFKWERGGSYEVSSAGDIRFSAFNAILKDGRSIEQHYQCDVKGYDPGGTDGGLGKGKPPLKKSMTRSEQWEAYLALWAEWAKNNATMMVALKAKAEAHNGVLSDCFATSSINQAHALAHSLNQRFHKEPDARRIRR